MKFRILCERIDDETREDCVIEFGVVGVYNSLGVPNDFVVLTACYTLNERIAQIVASAPLKISSVTHEIKGDHHGDESMFMIIEFASDCDISFKKLRIIERQLDSASREFYPDLFVYKNIAGGSGKIAKDDDDK